MSEKALCEVNMTYSTMRSYFRAAERAHQHLSGFIVFSPASFEKEYSVESRRVCGHTERRSGRMSYSDVPIWEKYTLTIEEAAKYFRIGEKKLRKLVEENSDANWLIMNGNRVQIKRRQFEKVIDSLDVI